MLVIFALLSVSALYGQDIYTYSVRRADTLRTVTDKRFYTYFAMDSVSLDASFATNGEMLDAVRRDIGQVLAGGMYLSDTVRIRGTASPDGPAAWNAHLAHARALVLRDTVDAMLGGRGRMTFVIEEVPEDWLMLGLIVSGNVDCPDREAALAVIRDGGLDDGQKKAGLKRMRVFWRWLQRNHAYRARCASVAYSVIHDRVTADIVAASVHDTVTYTLPPLSVPPPRPTAPVPVLRERRMLLAVRSNLLVPLLNGGLEVPIGRHHSVGADFYSPWFLSSDNRYCFELQCLSAGWRYWFGGGRDGRYDWTAGRKLVGHAVGLYAHAGHYDFQRLDSGYQGEFVGCGVEWTFGCPVARGRLRMEFSLGLGYMYNRYRHYNPDEEYVILVKDLDYGERTTHFFGPTRACVSLAVPIYARTGVRR